MAAVLLSDDPETYWNGMREQDQYSLLWQYDHITLSGEPPDPATQAAFDALTASEPWLPSERFINWEKFAKRDSTPRQWLVESFWPLGRAMALYASAKEGKSELVLWCAAKLALGVHPWTGASLPAVDVAYFDYEMTEDDLEERLDEMGFDPLLLDHLHYALHPMIPELDTPEGGSEFLDWVTSVQARAAVIDTFGRSVKGPENDADTVREFYRHTGMRLKRAGISYLRTDHTGKDPTAGQRGSSAKRDDVDVIWWQRRLNGGVHLDCTGSRLSWVGPTLQIDRFVDPHTEIVSYSSPIRIGWGPGVADKARELDKVGAPLDATRSRADEMLRQAGIKPGRHKLVAEALKYRREGQLLSPPSGTASRGQAAEAASVSGQEMAPDQDGDRAGDSGDNSPA